MSSDTTDYGKLAYDRILIADACYRIADGLDLADRDARFEALSASLAEGAVLDLVGIRKHGVDAPTVSGREEVISFLLDLAGGLETSHTLSNILARVDGDTATLRAHIWAQHFMHGEGPNRESSDHALFMNTWQGELVRDGDLWKFKLLIVDNLWYLGAPDFVTRGTKPTAT